MCFTGYITSDPSVASQSGKYFTDLSGCTISLLDDLTKEDHADYSEAFDYLYKAAQNNLITDVQLKLAKRFHVDRKLITRETSEFKDDFNENSGMAGVKIQVTMPKYSRLTILSISVYSDSAQSSPEAEFLVYKEDESGELLSTITAELAAGRNTVPVYQSFEEEKLFIGFDADTLSLKQTKNKYYPTDSMINGWEDLACTFPCHFGGSGAVYQVNGGGLNIKFILECSIEKLICENLPLFAQALLYKLGIETMKERITSQKVNRTTVMTTERAEQLLGVFTDDYNAALDAATENLKMTEDPICFMCKRTVSTRTNLP